MKTEMNLNNDPEGISYPLLAQRIDTSYGASFVVLFSDECKGTVIHAQHNVDPSYAVGKHLDYWTEVTDKDTWKILPKGSTVVLTA